MCLDLRGMDGVGRVFGPQKDGQTYAAAGCGVGGMVWWGGGVCEGVMGLATEQSLTKLAFFALFLLKSPPAEQKKFLITSQHLFPRCWYAPLASARKNLSFCGNFLGTAKLILGLPAAC